MRFPLAVGLATLGASLVACTALLGDFKVDPNAVVPGGVTDGGSDGEIIAEGGQADGPTDALADVTPLPPVLTCGVNGVPVTLLANTGASERLGVHTFRAGGTKHRVMWIPGNGSTSVKFLTVDENFSNFEPTFAELNASPQETASYDGGFVAIGVSQTMGPHLNAVRFDDSSSTPGNSTDITGYALFTPVAKNFSIAVAPLGSDDFFVVFSSTEDDINYTMWAGHATIPAVSGAILMPKPFAKVAANIHIRPDFDSHRLLVDKVNNRALLFMAPDQGNDPTTLQRFDLDTGAPAGTPEVIAPIHAGARFIPFGMQTDVAPAALNKAGVAFLEYNLNSTTDPLYIYATAIPANTVSSFKLAQLPPPVSFMTTGDVAVDKGRSFWSHYPAAGSHLVSAARKTNTGQGLNFTWIDGNGHLRGKASGATALVPSDIVAGAAGTMAGPPTVLLANAVVTWVTATGDIRIANIGCN